MVLGIRYVVYGELMPEIIDMAAYRKPEKPETVNQKYVSRSCF